MANGSSAEIIRQNNKPTTTRTDDKAVTKNQSGPNIGASMALQICIKGLTFGMNNWIARRTAAAYLGIVTVRFEFILTVVTMLAREGVRRALLRSKMDDLKAAWISIVLSALVSLVVCAVAALSVPQEISSANTYYRTLGLYALSAIIEATTDGPLIYCLREGLGKQRVWVESGSMILKVATVILALQKHHIEMDQFIDAFARGQLSYSISLALSYWYLMPAHLSSSFFSWPEKEFYRLASSLCGQNFFKFILGQGDMLVINAFASLKDQGTFAIANNYGSLVLRLVFQPLEEASMTFFARERLSPAALGYFSRTLKALIYLSLLFSCFATFFTWPVVRFILGRKWIEEDGGVVIALAAYCVLIGTAGISGFLESLVHVVIEEQWLVRSRNWTLVISIAYCVLAVTLITKLQTPGLILAGAANFGMRALLNAAIISSYAPKAIWNTSVPNRSVFVSFAFAALVNAVALWRYGMNAWVVRLVPATISAVLICINAFKNDFQFFKSFLK